MTESWSSELNENETQKRADHNQSTNKMVVETWSALPPTSRRSHGEARPGRIRSSHASAATTTGCGTGHTHPCHRSYFGAGEWGIFAGFHCGPWLRASPVLTRLTSAAKLYNGTSVLGACTRQPSCKRKGRAFRWFISRYQTRKSTSLLVISTGAPWSYKLLFPPSEQKPKFLENLA